MESAHHSVALKLPCAAPQWSIVAKFCSFKVKEEVSKLSCRKRGFVFQDRKVFLEHDHAPEVLREKKEKSFKSSTGGFAVLFGRAKDPRLNLRPCKWLKTKNVFSCQILEISLGQYRWQPWRTCVTQSAQHSGRRWKYKVIFHYRTCSTLMNPTPGYKHLLGLGSVWSERSNPRNSIDRYTR